MTILEKGNVITEKGVYVITRSTSTGIGYRISCPKCGRMFTPLGQKVDVKTGLIDGNVKCMSYGCTFEDQITLKGL